MLIQSSK